MVVQSRLRHNSNGHPTTQGIARTREEVSTATTHGTLEETDLDRAHLVDIETPATIVSNITMKNSQGTSKKPSSNTRRAKNASAADYKLRRKSATR
jgi:hypothetical protein